MSNIDEKLLYHFIDGYEPDSESTYDIWKAAGNEGGAAEFLEFMQKANVPTKTSELTNDSGYVALDDNGTNKEKTWSSSKIKNEFDAVGEKLGGTVEITSNNPSKANTVMTIDPSAEEINVYSVDEVDAITDELADKADDMQRQINVERARINTFTALGEGSTTGDAELADARVDKDGTTHANVGEHIRTVTHELNEILDNNSFTPTWIDGYYVMWENGSIIPLTASSYCEIDLTMMNGIDHILVKTTSYNDGRGYAFYDALGVFISGGQITGSDNRTLSITNLEIPTNAVWLKYSCLTTQKENSKVYIMQSFSDLQTYVNEVVAKSGKRKTLLEIDYTIGYYLRADGSRVSWKDTCGVSDSIPVTEGDVFEITGCIAGEAVLYCIFDANGTVMETLANGASQVTVVSAEVVIPENAAYIVFGTMRIDETVVYKVNEFGETLRNHENRLAVLETEQEGILYEYAVSNVLCIGDSLTSGANYTGTWGGSSIQQNYPYYLGRMLNCDVTNGGRSGWSASDWYRDYISTYDFATYDGIIIWLGTNYGCSSMPTDEEIETFVPDTSVSAENADQALYLIEIVKTIQEANPDCFILICGIWASKANVSNNNATVQQIAEKYGLHYVDTTELSTSNAPELHGGIQNVHFGKAGNIYIANKFAKEIRSIISENPLLAEFGLTAKTN